MILVRLKVEKRSVFEVNLWNRVYAMIEKGVLMRQRSIQEVRIF